MARLVRCAELQEDANLLMWEDMMILYCRRSIIEDCRLAKEFKTVCGEVANVILGRETERRAREKELFIEKLKVESDATLFLWGVATDQFTVLLGSLVLIDT
ncbi:hypothetical protein Tco_0724259 [Tanacetum coccineum]